MAVSTHASARHPVHSKPDPVADGEPSELKSSIVESLTLQACDDADSLREVLCAYVCLEKLLAPLEASDTEQIDPTRTELSALLRLVNEEMERRVEVIDKAAHAVRAAFMAAAN
ncbi:hypothetical protein QMO14_07200 [Variovorax sp. CAN2819]|uniref:hypothetical protein n=1 Tax=Variovorax sp. CAN15 TaxID=3046727 RepID=UPI00264A1B53|nr:hypothetical protein [Variovorax sp. CAN15]MDN6883386.1 hypothetical protein [Variovorax sp. CAN15]